MLKIWRPKSTIESIVKTLEAEKFEESDIELFVEAAFEDADEVIIEETSVELIGEAVLEAAERVDEEADEITIE